MQDFRNLRVWGKSHALTLKVYEATGCFPRHELYGLTSQIRRAASSIPENIAEGCGRGGELDFARFCQVAMGSASELEYELLLARDLRFLDPKVHQSLMPELAEIKRMLSSLIRAARNRHIRLQQGLDSAPKGQRPTTED
jgi:four helix bundle protein